MGTLGKVAGGVSLYSGLKDIASKDFKGCNIAPKAESTMPEIFPSNDPKKFSTAHKGVVTNLSII